MTLVLEISVLPSVTTVTTDRRHKSTSAELEQGQLAWSLRGNVGSEFYGLGRVVDSHDRISMR